MSEKKPERVKICLIIGLSIVLIVVVYSRFFHKKTTHAAVPMRYKARCVRLPIPQVQVPDLQGGKQSEQAVRGIGRLIPRDIFEPLKTSPPTKEAQRRPQKPSRPTMSLNLKGTIVGGDKAIAVINDQFVHTGDRIGDYEVVTIGKDQVVLTSDIHGHTMVLNVLKIAEK